MAATILFALVLGLLFLGVPVAISLGAILHHCDRLFIARFHVVRGAAIVQCLAALYVVGHPPSSFWPPALCLQVASQSGSFALPLQLSAIFVAA